MEFIKNHRRSIFAFVILTIMTAASGFYLFVTAPTLPAETVPTPAALKQDFTATPLPAVSPATTVPPPSTINAEQTSPDGTTAKLVVNDQIFQGAIGVTTSVYDFMSQLSQTQGLKFNAKEFAGMGYFVEEINGTKNNNQAGVYWIFYVNGEASKIGVSQYVLKSNDVITWKYEQAKF